MWNPSGGPPRHPNDPTDDYTEAVRRDSDARVAAVSALTAFARSSGSVGGVAYPAPATSSHPGPPPPPPHHHHHPYAYAPGTAHGPSDAGVPSSAARAYSAGYAPQHPLFLAHPTAASASPSFYPPPHYTSTAAAASSYWPPPAVDRPAVAPPRGKPEAMAARLAALQVESTRQELLEEEERQQSRTPAVDHHETAEEEEDQDQDPPKEPGARVPAEEEPEPDAEEDNDDDEEDDDDDPGVAPASREEPVVKDHVLEDGGVLANLHAPLGKAAAPAPAPRKKPSKPKKPTGKEPNRTSTTDNWDWPPPDQRTERLLEEEAPPITEEEYLCVEELMDQFCRVPLLNEFSRPVAVLHPELMASYTKIVSHPIDLGLVCRGIRARKYHNTRDIRLDIWRVFSNCVKFHSHPNNKDALPSFVSIGLHLREYFNALWDEYMLPSDLPEHASPLLRAAFAKRSADRKKRLDNSSVLATGKRHLARTRELLREFIHAGARVDRLDHAPLWDYSQLGQGGRVEERDLQEVVAHLERLVAQLAELADEALTPEDTYSMGKFFEDLMACVPTDLAELNPALRNRIWNRMRRFFWKRFNPLHEANSRGVTQSSIWGNVAATVWARESSKKPFWPALCLGILSSPEGRESWHATVTERNESRLPEKLRTQLIIARRKCEQSQAKQSYSWFLVEFLGTHEFIWIRETDIVDSFDPDDDPNKSANHASKRKRTPRNAMHSAVNSKTYATAVNECVWASEEYENTLMDAFDEAPSDEDNERSFTFEALATADEEFDDETEYNFVHNVDAMSLSDVEEANYLLAHDGATNFDRKKKPPPKRSPAKKKAPEKEKKDTVDATKKAKAELAKRKNRAKEEKKEQRDLERRRKKRSRDREKALKDATARKNKRPRSLSGVDEDDRGLATNKRARATAIVKAYLLRMAKRDEEYRSLALNGVMTIPAAMIESTGLIGMALAFRAAAGDLNMPDESEEQITKNTRPWDAIDATKGKTSLERSEALEKQIKLLESEISRVRKDSLRRRELVEEALAKRKVMDQGILSDDQAARVNHFKKKKKASPAKPKSKNGLSESSLKDEDDDDDEEDESIVAEVEAEPVVDGDDFEDATSSAPRRGSEADTMAESVEMSDGDGSERMDKPSVDEPLQEQKDDDKNAAAEAIAALAGFMES